MNRQQDNCISQITAREVHSLLSGSGEYAFLDVREEGSYCEGHAFYAASAPLSHLETRLPKLVPRKTTPVVLMDGGDTDLALRSGWRLHAWGYTDVTVVSGGLDGWREAGFPVFSGIFVPSKAFGEFVEAKYDTPSVDARTLQSWIDEGKDMVILDSRPYEEFHQFCIPGAVNCPGSELVHRAYGAVGSEHTTIVVNCAGRTRGIIGAQSLINAGIRNPVVSLKNGTQGWVLSGREMERGSTKVAPPPTAVGLRCATEAAAEVAKRFGIIEIDSGQFDELGKEIERTLCRFDVRTPEEYAAGHLPGFHSAPGGQLIQSTDYYVGTRNARIVLSDDTGVRARMTASWLLQLGWKEVYVLKGGLAQRGCFLSYGNEPVVVLPPIERPVNETITVAELAAALADGSVEVLDLASSLDYRRGHIQGAWFIVRARLESDMPQLDSTKPLVLTSPDGRFARLASGDSVKDAGRSVRCLLGGTAAWKAAGLPLSEGYERMASIPNDVWYSPYEAEDQRAAMEAYLKWETDLIDQIKVGGAMVFT